MKAEYTYDALGRRIEKIAGGVTTRYYYDGWRVLTETDENEAVQREYVYGNYLDEVLIKVEDNEDIYYAHDHLFSVVALIDDEGDVIERYEYDAYGKQTIFEPDFSAERNTSSYNNVVAFTGQRLDDLDGNNHLLIMYYKNRYYLPDIGRFIQTDPLGVNDSICIIEFTDSGVPHFPRPHDTIGQYYDGANIYEYVKSNPTDFMDIFGTSSYRWSPYPGSGYYPNQKVPKCEMSDPFNSFAYYLSFSGEPVEFGDSYMEKFKRNNLSVGGIKNEILSEVVAKAKCNDSIRIGPLTNTWHDNPSGSYWDIMYNETAGSISDIFYSASCVIECTSFMPKQPGCPCCCWCYGNCDIHFSISDNYNFDGNNNSGLTLFKLFGAPYDITGSTDDFLYAQFKKCP